MPENGGDGRGDRADRRPDGGQAGAPEALDAQGLMDKYYEVAMEGVDLKGFLQRLDAGEFGPVEPQAVVDFLRELEAMILSNIEVKAQEAPHYAERRLEVIEETRREFDELVARYLRRLP